jgi:hypothetical protein
MVQENHTTRFPPCVSECPWHLYHHHMSPTSTTQGVRMGEEEQTNGHTHNNANNNNCFEPPFLWLFESPSFLLERPGKQEQQEKNIRVAEAAHVPAQTPLCLCRRARAPCASVYTETLSFRWWKKESVCLGVREQGQKEDDQCCVCVEKGGGTIFGYFSPPLL